MTPGADVYSRLLTEDMDTETRIFWRAVGVAALVGFLLVAYLIFVLA